MFGKRNFRTSRIARQFNKKGRFVPQASHLALAKYLKELPQDPADGDAATTGYQVAVDSNNLVTITACSAENSETVEVSR